MADTPDLHDGGSPATDDEVWYLNDEQEFLVRSLEDADREHEAGDLSDVDHAALTARDRQRLREVEAALGELGRAPVPRPAEVVAEPDEPQGVRRSAWRRIGIAASCFLILAGIVILVVHAVTPRQPGQASSGSISESKAQLIEQQLDEALNFNNAGNPVQALKTYQKVLTEDPNDPEALAASGFIEWNYGSSGASPTLEATGRKAEEKAIRVAPTFYAGHLFLGLILYNQDHNAAGAVAQFNQFLGDALPAGELAKVAPLLVGAYTAAGVPVPSSLASVTASTTTTTTSTP